MSQKPAKIDQTASARISLQGLVASRADAEALRDALEQAFDYRGDVTITTTDGRTIEGYIFDRRRGEDLESSTLRLLPTDADERVTLRFSEIDGLEFSGRDAAHGKSFDTWLSKWVERRTKELREAGAIPAPAVEKA